MVRPPRKADVRRMAGVVAAFLNATAAGAAPA
jgi:hypothetical protein